MMVDATPAPLPFSQMIDEWATERKHDHTRDDAGTIIRMDEARTNVEMVFRHLAAFVGTDDAAKVSIDNLNTYKRELLKTKRSQDTVKKYIALIKTVFALASANHRTQLPVNPAAELKFVPVKELRHSRQDGFSMPEMAKLVPAARQCPKAVVRIPVLIAAYSGACLAEIIEAHKCDFEETPEGGLIFRVRLDNRAPACRIKTEFRVRRFPLHPCIVAEVKAYLSTIEDGALFPTIKVDRFGRQAKNGGEHVRKWIRQQGIKRKGDAFHCFRHTAKTAFRRSYPEGSDIRDYLTGHSSGAAADYGRYPIASLKEVMESLPVNPLDWQLE
jgi:integrase